MSVTAVWLLVVTHVVAVVLAVAAALAYRPLRGRLLQRRRKRDRIRDFWQRQTVAGLSRSGVLDRSAPMPQFCSIPHQMFAADVTLRVMSHCIRHELFETFDRQPLRTTNEIALQLRCSERHARTLIETLLAAGMLAVQDGRYAATPSARMYLRKDSPFFLEGLPPLAGHQLRALKGERAPSTARRWAAGKSERAEVWAMNMHGKSFPLGFALASTGLLADARHVLDVAGGAGSVSIALALAHPTLKLTVLELPDSVPCARRMAETYGVSHQIECVAGDMFRSSWPKNVDAVLFSQIFHDWDDAKCAALARSAFEALRPGGRVIVQEALLDDEHPGPLGVAAWSVLMSLMMEGRQFRGRELAAMLEDAGFTAPSSRPLYGIYSVVTAERQRVDAALAREAADGRVVVAR